MDSEQRALEERKEFEAWFADNAWRILPNKEDIPPKHYKLYIKIAYMAWQEVMCRKNLAIYSLKNKESN